MHISLTLSLTLSLCGQLLAAPVSHTPTTNDCDISHEITRQLRAQPIPLDFQPWEQNEDEKSDPGHPISISKVDCEAPSTSSDSSGSSVFCLRVGSAIGESLRPSSSGGRMSFVSKIGDSRVTCTTTDDARTDDIKLRCASVESERLWGTVRRPWVSKFLIFAAVWITGCTFRKLWVESRAYRASNQAVPRSEWNMSEKSPVLFVEEDLEDCDDSNYPMG